MLTADVPRGAVEAIAAALVAAHQRLHRAGGPLTVAGFEIIGDVVSEVGLPSWQSVLGGVLQGAQQVLPVLGQSLGGAVTPWLGLASQAAGAGASALGAPQLALPPVPAAALPSQNAPGGPLPGFAGLLSGLTRSEGPAAASLANVAPFLASLLGGAGLVSGALEAVHETPDTFGGYAAELASLLPCVLQALDGHAAAAAGLGELSRRQLDYLGRANTPRLRNALEIASLLVEG